MKKIIALLLAMVLVLGLVACQGSKPGEGGNTADFRVAMITDYGDITDQSFNQTTYEAGKAWCEANKVDYTYYKPTGDSTAERVAMVDKAVADGYNVLLLPGFAFGGTIAETAANYPEVKFVALDVSAFDLGLDPVPANVFSAVYQEELPGYMAGYAAVKLGYTKLGFLGGMAVPAVIRYGYGFVQGANAAAEELGKTGEVSVNYVYGNQFYGDADIKAYMDTWYAGETEVVFACGGGIFTSAAEAAAATGKKVIGVDVDQAGVIDSQFGEGLTVTSAMKGLAATVNTVLTDLAAGKWDNYSGKVTTLGLISKNPSENYVALGESTQWNEGFTQADYEALVAAMFEGTVKVSNDTENAPEVSIAVDYQGNIK